MQDIEHVNGILCGSLMTVNRIVGIYNLLHALTDIPCILKGHRVTNVQIHLIAVAYVYVDSHFTGRVQVVHSLAEDEEQRSGIGTLS